MENFFSALAIVWRKIFSAFGVIVLACIKEIPYGFGGGVPYCELGEEQVEDDGDGAAAASFGFDGKPGHLVREKLDEDDVVSEIEALLDFVLKGLVGVGGSEVVLNSDRAGDVAIEWSGEVDRGGDAGAVGTWMSFRTTMREMCNRFLANRVETYSRADVSCGGSCFASCSDGPASRGDEMRFLVIPITTVRSQ
jgi:hypothetical protein